MHMIHVLPVSAVLSVDWRSIVQYAAVQESLYGRICCVLLDTQLVQECRYKRGHARARAGLQTSHTAADL